jgi:hemerythrin-like domain-containing protein
MLDILIDDHIQARKLMATLAEANRKYVKGDADAGNDIITSLKALTVLYRKHIELEDKHFFIPSLSYFTKDEMNAMLSDMWEYDRTIIHIKYRQMVGQAKEMIGR